MKIDGKNIADEIILRLKEEQKPKKILAIILVGDDSRSLSFIKQKEGAAEKLGIDMRLYKLKEILGNDGLRKEVGRISAQKTVGGVLVQLPLPSSLNEQYILNAIPREKDVDVLGERALGAFYAGRNTVLPPAVSVVEEILNKMRIEPRNTTMAIVGLGSLIGKPISIWAIGQKFKEIILLRNGSDLTLMSAANIIISGVGRAGLIAPKILKKDAGIIDFGYSYSGDGKLSGDFDASDEDAIEKLGFYTPTPGGTGPILVAKLMENFYKLCQKE